MFVKTYAGAVVGIDAVEVTVEVNLTSGIGLYLVGLPDNAVKESEERIRSAFENCEERFSGKKIVVNLAPADLRKEGSGFDVAILTGILHAVGAIHRDTRLDDCCFIGELSLSGNVVGVRGAQGDAAAAGLLQGAAQVTLNTRMITMSVRTGGWTRSHCSSAE